MHITLLMIEFIQKNSPAVKKMCGPIVKKDMKSKVAAKKWL